jgi:hypothetical protein
MDATCIRLFYSKSLAFLLGFALSITFTPVYAAHDLDFELDHDADGANILNDGDLDVDWEDLFDVSGDAIPTEAMPPPTNFGPSVFLRDFVPGAKGPDTSAYTSGSSDVNDIAAWSCTRSNNIGAKFNIVNAYATAYYDSSSGDAWVYFALSRVGNEGTASVGFWFLGDGTVECVHPSGGGSTGFTGNHMDGDTLVVSEFTDGGKVGEIKAYKWVGGPGGYLDTTPLATGGDCADAGPGDTICATINNTTLTGYGAGEDIPWLVETKQPGNTPSNNLDELLFFEGGLNLTANGLGPCFATFHATTRSSTSLTAALHDFTSGSFPLCAIEISKSCGTGTYDAATNSIKIPYQVTINNTGSGPVPNVMAYDNDCGFGSGQTIDFGTVAAGATPTSETKYCYIPDGTDLTSGITNGVYATAGGGITVELADSCTTATCNSGTCTIGGAACTEDSDCDDVCYDSCAFNLTPQIGVSKQCEMRLALDDQTSPMAIQVVSDIMGQVCNTSDQDQVDTCVMDVCTLGEGACSTDADCTEPTIPAAPVPLEMVAVVDNNGTPSTSDDVTLQLYDTCLDTASELPCDGGTCECVIAGTTCGVDTDCATPSTLEPGQCAYFDTSYLPTVLNSTCPADAEFSDTVTASAVDSFTGNSVMDMATATCELCDEDCSAD